MKKQPMSAESIAANTDEYGIIHWENIEIPRLNLKRGKLEIRDVPPKDEKDETKQSAGK